MPNDLENILDDADDSNLPAWQRYGPVGPSNAGGVFHVLNTSLGVATIIEYLVTGYAWGIVHYPDGTCFLLPEKMFYDMKQACEAALRERPTAWEHHLDIGEDEEKPAQAAPEPVHPPPVEREKPPPRQWNTVPITAGDDDDWADPFRAPR